MLVAQSKGEVALVNLPPLFRLTDNGPVKVREDGSNRKHLFHLLLLSLRASERDVVMAISSEWELSLEGKTRMHPQYGAVRSLGLKTRNQLVILPPGSGAKASRILLKENKRETWHFENKPGAGIRYGRNVMSFKVNNAR